MRGLRLRYFATSAAVTNDSIRARSNHSHHTSSSLSDRIHRVEDSSFSKIERIPVASLMEVELANARKCGGEHNGARAATLAEMSGVSQYFDENVLSSCRDLDTGPNALPSLAARLEPA